VNPVVAVVLGWALAGEAISPRTLLAMGVIVTGVVLITSSRSGPKREPKPATLNLELSHEK
jgi:drug/metabolite transporter (DMT)-like permease